MKDILDFKPSGKKQRKKKGYSSACYLTHKPLPVTIDGTEYEIYGTSVTKHKVTKEMTDVLISLDGGSHLTELMHPWVDGEQWHFPIRDMNPPSNVAEFRKLLKHMKAAVKDGRRVMVGCIGGHGRTGTVLAAFVAYCEGRADAIEYVRANYCEKAVESTQQIQWLVKHFKVDKAEPTKGAYRGGHGIGGGTHDLFGGASNYKGPQSSQDLASKEHDWDAWTAELDRQNLTDGEGGGYYASGPITPGLDPGMGTPRPKTVDKHARQAGSSRSLLGTNKVKDI